eukprot:1160865-Pelagomonas_calceolata.AAC.2
MQPVPWQGDEECARFTLDYSKRECTTWCAHPLQQIESQGVEIQNLLKTTLLAIGLAGGAAASM